MAEKLRFSADAGVVARLGRELVGRQETALTELVKNAYDADATTVSVTLEVNGEDPVALVIADDGSGMDRNELVRGFLRIASATKATAPKSPRFGRRRAGRKGIGRFAAERLGRRLELITHAADGEPGHVLRVDWDSFVAGRDLDDVTVSLDLTEPALRGTSLRIEGLRDRWTRAQLNRCLLNLTGILQPFPIAPVSGDKNADPGFQVEFRRGGDLLEDTVIGDLASQIHVHASAVIEAQIDQTGHARWRITGNKFGSDRDWVSFPESGNAKSTYAHVRDVQIKAYYFILSSETLPALVYSRVRTLLGEHGGIRLYRNGFRVAPYGDFDDDWLGLDNLYARRSATLAPIANRNFFGVVEVHDPDGTLFEERTSREGLVDTPAFEELRSFLPAMLISAVNSIAADRGRIGSAATRTARSKPSAGEYVYRSRERLSHLIEQVQTQATPPAPEIVETLKEIQGDLTQGGEVLVQEAEMLRFLASIGMASSEFTHEIRMTFQAFGLDMDAVIAHARSSGGKLADTASRADAARERVEAFTGYFSEAMASRNLRVRAPASLKLAVKEFVRGIRPIAERQGIDLVSNVPEVDPLFTAPIHEAELSSILLNLLTNSIKAIKRAGADRVIRIDATRLADRRLSLKFSDTGDGIDPSLGREIFAPFVTTQAAATSRASEVQHAVGTGLGLWILSQIVEKLEGEVELAAPPAGFATSFEIILPGEEGGNG